MSDLCSGQLRIPEGSIVKYGNTSGRRGDHEYIVYVSGDRSYHVNGRFQKDERHTYIVDKHYDRKIADNDAEYSELSPSDIEKAAYNAYMDGAR